MSAIQVFVVLLVCGLTLLGAEVFVPGGVMGFFGGLCLLGAMLAGFPAFPGYGGYVAVSIGLLAGLAVMLWIRLFPGSIVGRRMTVSRDLADAKASGGFDGLLGKSGVAQSDLRPSGFALIDGRRVDVVTQGGMLPKGSAIIVVDVRGNRVVVSSPEN